MAVPVTKSQRSIDKFLKHISDAGIPSKVTNSYLRSAGFTSSNDSALIPVFKALGFVDAGGSPTERWKLYRDKDESKHILGEAIRECYSGLFDMYPDAERKDDEAIANWIRTNTDFAGITVSRAVATFKALAANASFGPNTRAASDVSREAGGEKTSPDANLYKFASVAGHGSSSPAININIELQLPPSSDPLVYENLFAAMKRHLLDNDQEP